LVFPRWRAVVFVDGDFWHGRQWQDRGFSSLDAQFAGVSNEPYWVTKIGRTVYRDAQNNETLRTLGWRVIRVWETDIRRDPQAKADWIASEIRGAA
jgi:DNA mismatch endonuclease (patch repair protein)